jgi:hypothetical protein
MRFLILIPILIISAYPISYAKFCWSKKNRIGAVGAVLVVLASLVVPLAYLIND